MIDLPGITYKDNLIEIIRRMINKYCSDNNTIILLVFPSDVDFSTSEAILLSGNHDKERERTLGVVTKIDRCEKNIKKKLIDNELNLKLGVVAVRNRN